MTVRAKFTVVGKKETPTGYVIEMQPVTGGGPENESFFKWTPFGKLEMGLVEQATADNFLVGKDYYLDFNPAF